MKTIMLTKWVIGDREKEDDEVKIGMTEDLHFCFDVRHALCPLDCAGERIFLQNSNIQLNHSGQARVGNQDLVCLKKPLVVLSIRIQIECGDQLIHLLIGVHQSKNNSKGLKVILCLIYLPIGEWFQFHFSNNDEHDYDSSEECF